MKSEIFKILDNAEKPLSVDEIKVFLSLQNSNDFKTFIKTLNESVESGEIYHTKKDKFMLFEKTGFKKGILSLNKKGFGFIKVDNEEFFITQDSLNGAIDKDEVIFSIKELTSGPKKEGLIISIFKRNRNQIVGLISISKQKISFKADDSRFSNFKINVLENHKLVDGHKVLIRLLKQTSPNEYNAEIVKILGHVNDPSVDILSIIYELQIPNEFAQDVKDEIDGISREIPKEEYEKRRNLTQKNFITIDGADAKDLDDAVYLEKHENLYKLYVSIADVSFYVKENTPLDLEAINRGTSVYLVDRVVPMLPHFLSNDICSLNPNLDRLTLTCEMDINENGDVIKYDIYESIINTTYRMTYSDINEMILRNDLNLKTKYESILPMITNMDKLFEILHAKRDAGGSIDFNVDEPKIILNELNEVADITLLVRERSERIIEEFMLVANQTVAAHMFWLEYPLIYRVHDEPSDQRVNQFYSMLDSFGVRFKKPQNDNSPKSYQLILEKIAGNENEKIISTLLLRSMQKAFYSEKCSGHFGLAFTHYCHFTSPIRRYPDLIVHRMLRKYIFNNHLEEVSNDHLKVAKLAMSSSIAERRAVECEREVLDMKKAEYMQKHVNEVYDGNISGITNFGIFVEVKNAIEGLIHVTDLRDDHYVFDDKHIQLVGLRTKKKYKLGQKVRVKVKAASKAEKTVDFQIVGGNYGNRKK